MRTAGCSDAQGLADIQVRLYFALASSYRFDQETHRLSSTIDQALVCPGSKHILCYSQAKDEAEVKLFSPQSPDSFASITPGIEGFTHAAFLSETDIAVWSDVCLKVTIWRIAISSSVKPLVHMQFPKLSPKYGWALRETDQRYFALCQRLNGKDVISIYDGQHDWQLAQVSLSLASSHSRLIWSLALRFCYQRCRRFELLCVWSLSNNLGINPRIYAIRLYFGRPSSM